MAQRGGRLSAKYRQIAADLRARIEAGEWAVDEQMPPLPDLSARYGAAQGTISRALDELQKLGMVETIHGMGTFVRELSPGRAAPDALVARMDEMASQIGLLREQTASLPELRDTVGRLEAVLIDVCARLGFEYQHGGEDDGSRPARYGRAGRR